MEKMCKCLESGLSLGREPGNLLTLKPALQAFCAGQVGWQSTVHHPLEGDRALC